MIRFPKHKVVEESLGVAVLLALVGGYLDIYSYLARGKVFANTQTGNLVLLGYNIAIGNRQRMIYYLLAIFSFISGICLSKVVEYKFVGYKWKKRGLKWLHIVLFMEMIILIGVMFIPQGKVNILANMSVSFVCGLQVQSFKKVHGHNYSTIMFTGNLRNLTDYFLEYTLTKEPEALKYGFIYLLVTLMFIIILPISSSL